MDNSEIILRKKTVSFFSPLAREIILWLFTMESSPTTRTSRCAEDRTGNVKNCSNPCLVQVFLQKKGHIFESETDTEVIAKLVLHLFNLPEHKDITFRQLVELVCQQLEGAFALVFKSTHYPGQVVATRRGSPLLVGILAKNKLATNHIPVYYSKERRGDQPMLSLCRNSSRAEFTPLGEDHMAEYFFASDASAIVEHTNRVIKNQSQKLH